MKIEKRTKSTSFHTIDIVTVSLAHLVHDTYTAFLPPLLPLLITKLSLNYSIAGLLSFFLRLPSLFNPFVGMIADKLHLRYFIIVAPFLTALTMSMLGMAHNMAVLLLLLFAAGISSTLFHVPSPVMIKQVAGGRVGMGMSFFMLGGEGARTLGPLIVLGAVSLWGLEGCWRLVFPGLIASIILYFRLGRTAIRQEFKARENKADPWHAFNKERPYFAALIGIFLMRAAMQSSLMIFLPTYLTARGESLWFGGMALSLLQLAGAGGTFIAGSLSDHIGRKQTLFISSGLAPVLVLLFTMMSGIPAMIMLVPIGILLFACGPVLLATVQDIETENPAFLNSIYMTISFVIGSGIAVLVGFSGDTIGLVATYRLSCVLAFAAIPFIIKLPRHGKPEKRGVR